MIINVKFELLDRVDASEFWLLSHIVKRLNKEMFCFPSNKTLLSDTGWHIDKLQKVKKSLVEKGFLSIEERFNADRRTSNTYYVTTDLIGVFVGADRLSGWRLADGSSIPEKTTVQTGKSGMSSIPENPAEEVLSSKEVLFPSNDGELFKKPALNPEIQLTPEKPSKKKKEAKPADECYADFVKMWCEAYPDLGFDGVAGKKVKALIKRTRERLTDAGKVADRESVNAAFAYVLAYVKRTDHFVHGKPITTFDQQYNSVVREIKEGKPAKKQQMPSSAVFSKYSNLT
jgi:hypothetical protein